MVVDRQLARPQISYLFGLVPIGLLDGWLDPSIV